MKTQRNSGSVLLAIICIVAMAAIIYVGYKFISKLMSHPFDPTHGVGTNVVDVASAEFAQFMADNPGATVSVMGTCATLPLTSLTQNWYYAVDTSTNLLDWERTDLDWPVTMTNTVEPRRFWRLNLIIEN
jgi:hypothetical protein